MESVVAPGFAGYFGVLAKHAPFVAELRVGELQVRQKDNTVHFATSGGFAEVLPEKVTVLAETAEEASEIDLQRAEAAKNRAHQRITEGRKAWDMDRAQAALARALNRLRVAGKIAA